MTKLDRVTSRVVCFTAENVNTDQIIPARFLKRIDKTGFGNDLFADMKPLEVFRLVRTRASGRSCSAVQTSDAAVRANMPCGRFAILAFAF